MRKLNVMLTPFSLPFSLQGHTAQDTVQLQQKPLRRQKTQTADRSRAAPRTSCPYPRSQVVRLIRNHVILC